VPCPRWDFRWWGILMRAESTHKFHPCECLRDQFPIKGFTWLSRRPATPYVEAVCLPRRHNCPAHQELGKRSQAGQECARWAEFTGHITASSNGDVFFLVGSAG